jgi:hypothetical protein
MAIFNHEEAIYAALCHIYGYEDGVISLNEKTGMKDIFLKRHYFSNNTMETISLKWSQSPNFYFDILDSLNECSYTQRLEAYRTICIVLNAFSKNRTDIVGPAHEIRDGINISAEEYNRYIGG